MERQTIELNFVPPRGGRRICKITDELENKDRVEDMEFLWRAVLICAAVDYRLFPRKNIHLTFI